MSTVDTDLASAVVGSLIWIRLEEAGLVERCDQLDRDISLDLLAICQEHAVLPDYDDTFAFIVQLARQTYSDLSDDYEAAHEWVLLALCDLDG
jgi:hypothetical protein